MENGLPFFRDVSVRFFVDATRRYWGEVDVLVERDETGAIAALRPSTRAEFEQKTHAGKNCALTTPRPRTPTRLQLERTR